MTSYDRVSFSSFLLILPVKPGFGGRTGEFVENINACPSNDPMVHHKGQPALKPAILVIYQNMTGKVWPGKLWATIF